MLHTERSHAESSDRASSSEIMTSFVGFIRRRYKIVLICTLVAVGISIVYLLVTPPRYTAQAKLIIDTHKIQLLQQQSVLGDIPIDAATVESQAELLRSENVALTVIKELNLTTDPEFVDSNGSAIGAVINFFLTLFSSRDPASEDAVTRRAVAAFQDRLVVKRVGLTYVIDLSFQSLSRSRAAQIANAIADAYIVDQLDAKYQATRRAATWLKDRLDELRSQASLAERAVVEFKTKNNIVDTGGRLMNEQQLAELNSALIQARAQTAEAQARLERVQLILHNDNLDPSGTDAATVTDTLHNEVIVKLRQQYLDYSAKESDWSKRYGSNHLAAVNLRNQMREVRRSILDELNRIAQTYRSDYEIAKAREDSVRNSLADIVAQSQTTNQAQIVLRDLESTSQTSRALYDSFLQRYMEASQQQSFPITEARVITQAVPPLRKSSPNLPLVLAVAVVLGTFAGFGGGILRELSDQVFRSATQIHDALQTNCIAVVPKLKPRSTRSLPSKPNGLTTPHVIARDDAVLWHISDVPFSQFAESIRAIKVAIDLTAPRRKAKVIGITSSLPNEGKSTISASLAQLISKSRLRVLLVDGDFRNPTLSRKMSPKAGAGLIEVAASGASLQSVAWFEPESKLWFLPTVMKTPISNTSDLLGSNEIAILFDKLRQHFDYVIIDLPPLAPVVDVRSTAHLVDAYVFVVEWGHTRVDLTKHVLQTAPEIYGNMLGVVLNKASIKVLSKYESHSATYYDKYRHRYGNNAESEHL
jgi:succinoglycan biosynthesis transport protein ExoP